VPVVRLIGERQFHVFDGQPEGFSGARRSFIYFELRHNLI
jgi:hypothetical protein